MSWRAITEDDVYSVLNDTEATALRTALTKSGQTDPMTQIIQQVAGYARDSIRSAAGNVLSPTTAHVPEGCVMAAVDIIVWRIAGRLGRALRPTDEMKEAWKAAVQYFRDVAAGKMAVESYGGAGTEVDGGGSMEKLTPTRRRADREGLAGL